MNSRREESLRWDLLGLAAVVILAFPDEAHARTICATKFDENFLPPTLGQTQVLLVVPPGIPLSSVTDAKTLWETSCSDATHLPRFSVASGTDRPQGQDEHTSIMFVFVSGLGPVKDSVRTLADYNPLTGIISVFERDDNGLIDWASPKGVRDLAHELGHALGLGHDTCSRDSLMRDRDLLPTARILTPHCRLTDFESCDPFNSTCPADPTRPGNPVSELSDHCARLPILCRGTGGGGGGGGVVAWWDYPETQPELTCESTFVVHCGNTGCSGTLTLHCSFRFAPTFGDFPAGGFTNNGPVLGIEAPLPNQTVSGTILVSGWALAERFGVQAMAVWLDGEPFDLGAFRYGTAAGAACAGIADPWCPNVGFSGFLDTRLLPNGSHTLQIVAVDGRVDYPTPTRLDVTFDVENCLDLQAPGVTLTHPTNQAVVAGTVIAQAAAFDNVGVAKVEFFVDGALKGTDTTAPFVYGWDTTLDGDGTHRLRAKAWDACNNSAFSPEVAVTVGNDTSPPQVSLSSPAANAVLSGTVAVRAQASDDVRVSRVEFYVDGALAGTELAAPFSLAWNTAQASDGLHRLTARAYDPSGKMGVSPEVPVTTENVHPLVRITSAGGPAIPENGSYTFPSTPAQAPVSRLFTLWNDGNATLAIANPTGLVAGNGFSLIETPPASLPAGASGTFRIRLHHSTPGTYSNTVRVESNEPGSPFMFTVRGTVTPAGPSVRIVAGGGAAVEAGGTYNFPSTAPGTPVSRLFTIYNDGTSELVIDSPAALVSGAGFSLIEPAPASIAAGSSGSFRVRLSSPGAGTYSGTVTVRSNDPTSPFEFAVRGTVQ